MNKQVTIPPIILLPTRYPRALRSCDLTLLSLSHRAPSGDRSMISAGGSAPNFCVGSFRSGCQHHSHVVMQQHIGSSCAIATSPSLAAAMLSRLGHHVCRGCEPMSERGGPP
jgi:hypothetical protein